MTTPEQQDAPIAAPPRSADAVPENERVADSGAQALRSAQAADAASKAKNIVLCSDGTGNSGGKGEGTVELSRRAIEEQHHRDEYLAKYHHYEFASAAFQIGIVLASATVITGMVVLSFLAGGLGVVGLAFMAFGLFAPHLLHLH